MSSVVAESSSQPASQPARSRPGQSGQSSESDGFSGLVDANLAAGEGEANAPAEQARHPARDGDPGQHGTRTGIRGKSRTETNSARSPQNEPSATAAAAAANTAAEKPAAAAGHMVRTGLTTAAVATEATPNAEVEETPAPAAPTATVVAAAVPVQIQLASEATPESVIETSDAISISNPPATIAAAPAETAANALARVALDTGEAQPEPVAADTETDIQTPPVTTETAEPADPDSTTAEETSTLVEMAAADAQLNAKATTELSAAAKRTASATPAEETPQANLASKPDIESVEKQDVTPEPSSTKPDPRTDRREANAASGARSDNAAETEPSPMQRAVHEASTVAAHSQATASEQSPPTGFGMSHAANVGVQAAQLTAVPAANVAVPIGGLAVEIAANVQIGRSRFEIRLDPPELGRIDVRLDVDRHGQVTSHLIVERSATLDLLRRDAQHLERALQDAGLKTSDNGLQFSLRDQQQQSGRNDDNGPQRNAHRLIVTDEEAIPTETAGRSYGRMTGPSGGIDIRV